MTNKYSSNGRTIIGLILVILGGLLFLRNVEFFVWHINIFSWPVIFLIIGIIILINNKNSGGGLVLVVLGAIGLISRYSAFSFRYLIHEYWPFLIVAFGIYLVLKRGTSSEMKKEETIVRDEHYLDAFSLLRSKTLKVITKSFLGGKVTSLLSGFKIDLTQAEYKNNITLDIVTILGGTEIFVPSGKNIIFNATTVFGGFEDNRSKQLVADVESDNVLVIKGIILFGGVEIKS